VKIAVYSIHPFEVPYLKAAFENRHEVVFITQELNEQTVKMAQFCDAVSLFTSDRANAAVLNQLHIYGVKYIALRSVGYDHVDLNKAKELAIRVANVPAYSPYSVAEHAVTLLMALNRKLILSQQLMQSGDFRLDGLTGFDMHEKTVGIVGLGKIGEAFANIMKGFGCKLLCYDPEFKPALEEQLNIRFVGFEELCINSDIISIHCPLNASTRHLFNKDIFSLMKKGIYIINTARGSVIKTEDLIWALDKGIVGGAGLDVYEFEKGLFFHDHHNTGIQDPVFKILRSYPNVLVTGHQAFLTETALQNIADSTLYNLDCFGAGKPSGNELW
jgi:D-lactate dehydrogenase